MSTPDPSLDSNALMDEAAAVTETFAQQLLKTYDRDTLKQLMTVGAFIMQGLQLPECAILASMSPDRLKQMMDDDVNVTAYIRVKQTALKAALLRPVMQRATGVGADAKVAVTLLEKLFPADFNAKPIDPSEKRDDSIMRQGIEAVREAGDHTPIVPQKALPKPEPLKAPTPAVAATIPAT